MSNLTVFDFQGHGVRFVGTADKPEWVASDVCRILGLNNVSQALSDFEEDEKGIIIDDTLGGKQQLLTVTAPGLYRLIFKSRKEVAVKFRRWVYAVIDSIRKTGKYETQPAEREEVEEYNYYKNNLANNRSKRPWKEKTEISESQLKVYCFLQDIDRWATANEIAEATKLHPATVRSFLVYFRRGGILDMLESFPRHLHKYSEMAEARNPSLVLKMERAIAILGNPLVKKNFPVF